MLCKEPHFLNSNENLKCILKLCYKEAKIIEFQNIKLKKKEKKSDAQDSVEHQTIQTVLVE